MISSAIFSPDRIYRYALWRRWDEDGADYAMFICLNPSTADENNDDPTVRRCINYAKAWGYSGLCMSNIFAFRATDPKVMKAEGNPVGPENDKHLVEMSDRAGVVVAAWGTHGVHHGREAQVRAMIPGLRVLRLTKEGHPAHPLYLPKTLEPLIWRTQ